MTLAGVWTDHQGFVQLVIEGNGPFGFRRQYAQTGIEIATGRIDLFADGSFYATGHGAAGLSRSRMWLAGPDTMQEQNVSDEITGFFNELLGQQPAIRTFYRSGASVQPVPRPFAPPFGAPLGPDASPVEVLLAHAQQATPEAADALFQQAIAAAMKTVTIDDDIAVMQQLVRSTKRVALSDSLLAAVTAMIVPLARQPARRDEIAHLFAWALLAVNRKGLTKEIGRGLVDTSRAILGDPLGEVAHVNLAVATAQALVLLAEPRPDAEQLLDTAARRTTDAGLLDAIEQTRRLVRG
jgi:hypothetical protein